ncbi:hypothetical protein A0O34_21885 (plasmid) [Chryseobacterium glaciei]|uniref:Topo IA-type catalytic domain-containing protein n=1 Tax=Chryseobacterium glaciei TaxID=1685010 RepID=A0A172Y1X1_9FLAO|nr:hypothetical protein A0O34_21885 [Chryseobacterium glaciei]
MTVRLNRSRFKIKVGNFNKRIVNDLKVTDHHGLLVTDKVPSALVGNESAVYDMIAVRLLESVCQPCKKEITTISTEVLHYEFSSKGIVIKEPGWRIIQGNFSDESEDAAEPLPYLK